MSRGKLAVFVAGRYRKPIVIRFTKWVHFRCGGSDWHDGRAKCSPAPGSIAAKSPIVTVRKMFHALVKLMFV